MPYDSKAIANYFLDKAEAENKPLDPIKLQKLVYFAHGWYLAIYGKPLINECVQAWRFGPVIRTLYHDFKNSGSGYICERATSLVIEGTTISFVKPSIPVEDTETQIFLDRIWTVYGSFSGWQLANFTHQEGGPWRKVYDKFNGQIPLNAVIPDDDIKAFFMKKAATT